MPQRRDNFLLWYQNYLEQLFVVVQLLEGMPNKHLTPELSQPHSQDSQNDSDLAEADKKNAVDESPIKRRRGQPSTKRVIHS